MVLVSTYKVVRLSLNRTPTISTGNVIYRDWQKKQKFADINVIHFKNVIGYRRFSTEIQNNNDNRLS